MSQLKDTKHLHQNLGLVMVQTGSYDIPKHSNWVEVHGRYLIDYDEAVATHTNKLIDELLSELPEEYEDYYAPDPVGKGHKIGYNQALREVTAILEKKKT